MKTEHIPYLLTVASTSSINKASHRLNYPTQKLCNLMTNVENEFETQLFVRSRNGISLTPAGDYFIENLHRINDILEETKKGLQSFEVGVQEVDGLIEVYSVPSLQEDYVVAATNHFVQKYPHISLTFQDHDMKQVIEKVLENPQSIGVIALEIPSSTESIISEYPELAFYPLFRRQPVVICKKSSDLVNVNKKTISLKSLNDLPFVFLSINKANVDYKYNLLHDLRVDQIKYSTNRKDVFFNFIESGVCCAFTGLDNINNVSFLLEHPELCIIPLRENIYYETNIVVNKSVQVSKQNKLFLNTLYDCRKMWPSWNKGNVFLDYGIYEKPNFLNI